jgi:hypothetical protein
VSRRGYESNEALARIAGVRPLHLKLFVTEQERANMKQAAKNSGPWSISTWAEVNLVTLAEVELSGGGTDG